MAEAPIKFGNQQATGQETLGGAPGVAVNVVVDDTGTVRRRPGIQAAPGLYSGVVDASGISGIYATIGGATYAVGSTPQFRRIWLMGPTGATALGAATDDTTLAGTGRPTFAETQLLLAIAGADKMQKIVLNTNVSSRILDNPPFASHVIANSSRLLGNIAAVSATNTFDKSVVRFSDIANGNASFAGMEVWTEGLGTAGHFAAEADPDPVLAIAENTNEVFCFGNTSLQVFAPNTSANVLDIYDPSVTRELGCQAAYSPVKVNQQFAWLDNLRRIVMSDARSEQVLSGPIWKDLDDMSVVTDCFGYRVTDGFLDALVWSFPTDGRTFAFQQGSGWAEWLSWNSATNNYAPFTVTASRLAPLSHDVLVGTADGRVGRFEVDATTDFGVPIRASVCSGFQARGTNKRKHCKKIRVSLKRGQSFGAVGPQAYISWRDDLGPYGQPIAIDLGTLGDTNPVLEFPSLGIYRLRDWKFEFTGIEDLRLVAVEEEFDILSN